jgi:hypothetical protein
LLLASLCAQLAILIIIVWVPGVQDFFGTNAPPAISLVPNLFFFVILLTLSEVIKVVRKKNPRALQWISW